jgi:hypothetical protein
MSATEVGEAPVDFLMVAGDGRDDEIVFRWANDLGETGTVKNVTTVSLGSRDTQAMKTLTQGVTGKFFGFYISCGIKAGWIADFSSPNRSSYGPPEAVHVVLMYTFEDIPHALLDSASELLCLYFSMIFFVSLMERSEMRMSNHFCHSL